MARKKMLRHVRAWGLFLQAFCDGRLRQPGFCRNSSWKRYLRTQRIAEKYYWRLICELRKLGIQVYVKDYLGFAYDAYNERFLVGGQWHPGKLRIELIHRCFPTLAHEFAHGIDQLLDNVCWPRSKQELIACGAGYLLTCECLGIESPAHDVSYAKRQGATEQDLRELEPYILRVFQQMKGLLE